MAPGIIRELCLLRPDATAHMTSAFSRLTLLAAALSCTFGAHAATSRSDVARPTDFTAVAVTNGPVICRSGKLLTCGRQVAGKLGMPGGSAAHSAYRFVEEDFTFDSGVGIFLQTAVSAARKAGQPDWRRRLAFRKVPEGYQLVQVGVQYRCQGGEWQKAACGSMSAAGKAGSAAAASAGRPGAPAPAGGSVQAGASAQAGVSARTDAPSKAGASAQAGAVPKADVPSQPGAASRDAASASPAAGHQAAGAASGTGAAAAGAAAARQMSGAGQSATAQDAAPAGLSGQGAARQGAATQPAPVQEAGHRPPVSSMPGTADTGNTPGNPPADRHDTPAPTTPATPTETLQSADTPASVPALDARWRPRQDATETGDAAASSPYGSGSQHHRPVPVGEDREDNTPGRHAGGRDAAPLAARERPADIVAAEPSLSASQLKQMHEAEASLARATAAQTPGVVDAGTRAGAVTAGKATTRTPPGVPMNTAAADASGLSVPGNAAFGASGKGGSRSSSTAAPASGGAGDTAMPGLAGTATAAGGSQGASVADIPADLMVPAPNGVPDVAERGGRGGQVRVPATHPATVHKASGFIPVALSTENATQLARPCEQPIDTCGRQVFESLFAEEARVLASLPPSQSRRESFIYADQPVTSAVYLVTVVDLPGEIIAGERIRIEFVRRGAGWVAASAGRQFKCHRGELSRLTWTDRQCQ